MARQYNFSRTINTPHGDETLSVTGFDSFDEARRAVESGIRDRKIEIQKEKEATAEKNFPAPTRPTGTGTSTTGAGIGVAPATTSGPAKGELPAHDHRQAHSSMQP